MIKMKPRKKFKTSMVGAVEYKSPNNPHELPHAKANTFLLTLPPQTPKQANKMIRKIAKQMRSGKVNARVIIIHYKGKEILLTPKNLLHFLKILKKYGVEVPSGKDRFPQKKKK